MEWNNWRKRLGFGATAIVYKGIYKNKNIAIKKIKLQIEDMTKPEIDSLIHEVKVLK